MLFISYIGCGISALFLMLTIVLLIACRSVQTVILVYRLVYALLPDTSTSDCHESY